MRPYREIGVVFVSCVRAGEAAAMQNISAAIAAAVSAASVFSKFNKRESMVSLSNAITLYLFRL